VPNTNGRFIKIPMILLIVAFVGGLIGNLSYTYAEDKENDREIAELKKESALTNQNLKNLTNQLEQFNANLEQEKQMEKQDATNAMLEELLKGQGKDPEKVIKKAKKKRDNE